MKPAMLSARHADRARPGWGRGHRRDRPPRRRGWRAPRPRGLPRHRGGAPALAPPSPPADHRRRLRPGRQLLPTTGMGCHTPDEPLPRQAPRPTPRSPAISTSSSESSSPGNTQASPHGQYANRVRGARRGTRPSCRRPPLSRPADVALPPGHASSPRPVREILRVAEHGESWGSHPRRQHHSSARWQTVPADGRQDFEGLRPCSTCTSAQEAALAAVALPPPAKGRPYWFDARAFSTERGCGCSSPGRTAAGAPASTPPVEVHDQVADRGVGGEDLGVDVGPGRRRCGSGCGARRARSGGR